MWSTQDLSFARNQGLDFNEKGNLVGWIRFTAVYNNDKLIINPSPEDFQLLANPDYIIEDRYKVRISHRGASGYDNHPYTEEVGGRILAFSRQNNIRLGDLHVYESYPNYLCDSASIELNRAFKDGLDLKKYLELFLIPRLYAHSFYEKFRKWPWGELSHNVLGILEWFARISPVGYAEIIDVSRESLKLIGKDKYSYILSKKYGGNHQCLCGSSEKLRICHPDVARGIWRIRDLRRYHGLSIEDLLRN